MFITIAAEPVAGVVLAVQVAVPVRHQGAAVPHVRRAVLLVVPVGAQDVLVRVRAGAPVVRVHAPVTVPVPVVPVVRDALAVQAVDRNLSSEDLWLSH